MRQDIALARIELEDARLEEIDLERVDQLIEWVKGARGANRRPTIEQEMATIELEIGRRDGITEAELRVAAHKQGFESLAEIENAELDPGGIVYFERRHATETDDHAQHQALLARLDRIERLLGELRSR